MCEYYGKYYESSQNLGDFVKYLKGYETVPQYTMPGTPKQSGIFERRNQTL